MELLKATYPERNTPASPSKGKEKSSLSPRQSERSQGRRWRVPPRRRALCTASVSHQKNPSSLHSFNSSQNVLSGKGQACCFLAHTPCLVNSRENNSDLCCCCTVRLPRLLPEKPTKKDWKNWQPSKKGQHFLIGSVTLGMSLTLLFWETWDLMRASLSSPNVLKVY